MKMKFTQRLVAMLLLCILQFGNLAFAKTPSDWILLKSEKNVSVYGLQTSCNGKDVVILKVVNDNATEVTLSWTLWGEASPRTAKINPKDLTQGGCESTSRQELNDYVPEGKTFESMKSEITIL